jgi:crossover junction endodeoxyribonuclease RuvC
MIRIIGIDPGLSNTGYGIIQVAGNRYEHLEHGVITTSSKTNTGERLKKIYKSLERIIKTFAPDEAGIESLYIAKNISSALPVAQAKGVVLMTFALAGIPAKEYTPLAIKQSIVGRGRAEKQQVQELTKMLLGLSDIPGPDHAADALAAAICHYHQSAVMKVVEGERP